MIQIEILIKDHNDCVDNDFNKPHVTKWIFNPETSDCVPWLPLEDYDECPSLRLSRWETDAELLNTYDIPAVVSEELIEEYLK